jgi:hypothetical protein
MTEVTFVVYRPWTERYEDEVARLALHRQRATLLHGLVNALGLEVKDWGLTDGEQPKEVVEIILILGPVIVPAVASIINTWITQQKIKKIEIKKPDGTVILLEGVLRSDLKVLEGIVKE